MLSGGHREVAIAHLVQQHTSAQGGGSAQRGLGGVSARGVGRGGEGAVRGGGRKCARRKEGGSAPWGGGVNV
jgi:hypothetical protein